MKLDCDMAELLGIHIGDGCISENERYSEYYLGGDITEERVYHDKWVKPLFDKKVMIPLYGYGVQYKEHPKVGVYGFYIFDKKLTDFFKGFGIEAGSKLNVKVPKPIFKNKFFIKRFLRGLFDTDGSLCFDKNRGAKIVRNNRPYIELGTVSKNLIDDLILMFKKLNLHPMLKKPYKGKKDKHIVYRIKIYRKSEVEFFVNSIEFKNSKHYTKWLVYKKLGYCPPRTTLKQRIKILEE